MLLKFLRENSINFIMFLKPSLRLTGGLVATYESASTRRFRLGRVDCIRAAHPEALSWCRSMDNDKLSRDDKKKFFESAMKKQTRVMLDNINGKGLDIPLLGLREGVKEAGLQEFQDLFQHESYQTLNHFKLSTSQVPVSLPLSFMGKKFLKKVINKFINS